MLLAEALDKPFAVAKAHVISDWSDRPIEVTAVRNGRCRHADTKWQYEDGDREIIVHRFLMHLDPPEPLRYYDQPLNWEKVTRNEKAVS